MAGATQEDGPEITLPASDDLSTYQFHVVTLATDGEVKLADDPTDPVEALIGVLQNKPRAVGEEAVVRVSGIAKAVGGEAVNPGIWVTCDGNGHIIAAVVGEEVQSVVGITIDAAVEDEIHEILVMPGSGYVAPA